MPNARLTDRFLKAHKVDRREEWTDTLTPGLTVRFTPSGAPTFYARFREGGRGSRYRRVRLGRFPTLDLAGARERMRAILAERARGGTGAEALPGLVTLEELVELYLRSQRDPGRRWLREVERFLRVDVLPELGARPAGSVRRRDLALILDRKVAGGSPIAANRLRAVLSRLFSWAFERELVAANPVAGLRPPAPERSRSRTLTDDELAAVWRELEFRHPTPRNLFRLLAITAARVGELRLARWSDLDGDRWRIPAAHSKSGREQSRHLSRLALELLEAQRSLRLPGELVFPSPRRPGEPLGPTAPSHAARAIVRATGVEWRPHDLRRTAASGITRLGWNRLVVARILHHADAGVTSIYDRYDYEREAAAALEAWGEHVRELVARSTRAAEIPPRPPAFGVNNS